MIFYFDFLSPYAYIGWSQIHALAARHGREVQDAPVLFAGILNAVGSKGPAELPNKRIYVFKDAYRKAHRAGLPPLVPPPSHPFNPLLALRAAAFPTDAATHRRFIDGLFAATWAGGGGIETEAAVGAIAEQAGLVADEVLAFARSEDTKAALRERTEQAIAQRVFGVPSVVVDGELFWGTDSFPDLEAYLAGADPVPKDLLERWTHLRPSAVRKGSLA